MDVNYGRGRPYSLGIEEEFQLLHPETFELTSRFDEVLAASGDDRIKAELMQSIAEVATPVSADVPEAVEHARELRAHLRDAAAQAGAVLASAGTHPFSRYEHQDVTEKERYQELVESLRWIADRALIFGLHVHVGLDSAQQAIQVCNGLRTWLPELLALSVNSPFWHGRLTGLHSTRTKVFEVFPRSGLPPAFDSWEEFEQLVARAVKTGSFEDYTFIWWDLRPHPRLGTIELRICDAQTRLQTVAAITALTQSLVATLAEEPRPKQPRLLVDENKWRAVRHGLDAKLVDLERDEERTARDAIMSLVELAEPAARRLGCAAELAEVERVLERGSGADEQLRVYEETGSLLAVAQWLAEATVADL